MKFILTNMLKAGETSAISFKVNVMGTSMEPRVRVLLDVKSSVLMFDATKVSNDTWSANLNLPRSTPAGSYNMSVEVILNGKVFKPTTQVVNVAGYEEDVSTPAQPFEGDNVKSQPVVSKPFEPKSLPSIAKAILKDFEAPRPSPPVVQQPKFENKVVKPQPIIDPKSIELPPPPKLKSLEKKAKSRPIQRIYSGMPTKPAQRTKFSIKDVVVEAHKIPSAAVLSTTKLPEARKSSTIRLVKEDLIYETT